MPAWKAYQDFVIKIERVDDTIYRVEAQGPTGEAESTFHVPFQRLEIENFLLRIGRPRSARHRGRVPQPLQPTIDFGGRLFNALLNGPVRDVFMQARHDALLNQYGLRVKLRLNAAPELADLPWEFLYDGRDFLTLNDATPLVRYLDLPNPPRPMLVELPLRILVTISAPHDLPELDVGEEQDKILEALAVLIDEGLVEVDFTADATLKQLQRKLRRARANDRPYHVWHYIGHGLFDDRSQASVLALTDRQNRYTQAGGFQLGTLFAAYPDLRLVLLNACEGARPNTEDPFAGVAASLVDRGIPAVIGMQFEITDDAAISLSEEFYTALVDGLPVDAALAEARRAVFFLPNWVEWATPVLFMRVADGKLFEVTSEGMKPPAAEQQTGHKKESHQPQSQIEHGEPEPAPAEVEIVEQEPKPALTRLPFEPEMVQIPAGPFLMGSPTSDELRYGDEPEQFELDLNYDYAIGKYPVTVRQYAAFIDAGGYRERRYWTDAGWDEKGNRSQPDYWDDDKWTGNDLLPVVGVSWYEAFAYCQWLAEATGRDYRLLTEAEWEKAARGGLTLADGSSNPVPGRTYPWGNDYIQGYANIDETYGDYKLSNGVYLSKTTPVGSYQPGVSPYGIHDMSGNVWEWCLSKWSESYTYPEDNNPDGTAARVFRGGSWSYDQQGCRCSSRNNFNPSGRYYNLGFRVGGAVPVK